MKKILLLLVIVFVTKTMEAKKITIYYGECNWVVYENASCTDIGNSIAYVAGMTCTETYKPGVVPVINVREDGQAYLNYSDGSKVKVGSDNTRKFFFETAKTIKSKEEFLAKLKEVLATDNGKVSSNRIKILQEDLDKEKSNQATSISRIVNFSTGEIQKMLFVKNQIITNKETCKALGVNSFTIAKGEYELKRDEKNKGGIAKLKLITPISIKSSTAIIINSGCWFRGEDCQTSGLSPCMESNLSNIPNMKLMPIIENGICSSMLISFPDASSTKLSSKEIKGLKTEL